MPKQNASAIGLDLGGSGVKWGLIDANGRILHSAVQPIVKSQGRQRILETLRECALTGVQVADELGLTVCAIGAGCPGAIDVRSGVSLGPTPHLPDWEGAPIAQILAELGYPVSVDNDANMAAYGEFKAGAGAGHRILVAVTLGTGIGGGIILDGEIFRGSNFNGAELGHVCVEVDGRSCSCGNRGCMECYAGGKSMVADIQSALQRGHESVLSERTDITPLDIFEAAARHDPLAEQIIKQVVDYLGAGLSSIVNVLNPDVIVIGGGIADAGQHFLDQIDIALRGRLMKPVKKTLAFKRMSLGNNAGFIGAALYAMQQIRE